MAPLFQAVKVEHAGTGDDITTIFKGNMDEEWVIGRVPHGGYVLAQVLEACIDFQLLNRPEHPDPLHVTAHYLNRNLIGPFEVRVKLVKHGRSFTNLTAEFVQEAQANLMAHLIFGNLSVPSEGRPKLTIKPPSPFARRLPLRHHPSQPPNFEAHNTWRYKFGDRMKISEDGAVYSRNEPENRVKLFEEVNDGPNGIREKVGGGGIEGARWLELIGGEDDHLRPSLIAFFADMTKGFPDIIPTKGSGTWHPTVVLTITFFFPLPSPSSPDHASRTVGLYGTSNFMVDPLGRHDANAEVWTAPSNIGEGDIREGWRDKQVCLASATQMAITMPMELTRRKAKL